MEHFYETFTKNNVPEIKTIANNTNIIHVNILWLQVLYYIVYRFKHKVRRKSYLLLRMVIQIIANQFILFLKKSLKYSSSSYRLLNFSTIGRFLS